MQSAKICFPKHYNFKEYDFPNIIIGKNVLFQTLQSPGIWFPKTTIGKIMLFQTIKSKGILFSRRYNGQTRAFPDIIPDNTICKNMLFPDIKISKVMISRQCNLQEYVFSHNTISKNMGFSNHCYRQDYAVPDNAISLMTPSRAGNTTGTRMGTHWKHI